MEIEDSMVSRLTDFVIKNMPQYEGMDRDISHIIKKHHEFRTLDFELVENEIIYIVRYNISEDGKICNVLDFVIDKYYRNKKLIQYVIFKNWKHFPHVEFIRFVREGKYPNRRGKMYKILEFLGVKKER